MERSVKNEFFKKGDIVSVSFPFSNLEETKIRPALILAQADTDDFVICAITSKPGREDKITLEDTDFQTGKLPVSPSYIRPNYLFTADKNLVRKKIGELEDNKLNEVVLKLVEIIQRTPGDKPAPLKATERFKRK